MTTKPKLNVSLLKRILKHLREEPKRYYQTMWGKQINPEYAEAPACGTQGCIAGWAVLLQVPRNLWNNLFEGGAFAMCQTVLGTMSCAPVTKAAQELLGLTDAEALALFKSINQTHVQGEAGVKEAAAKINLLVRNRTAFVQRYH